MICGPWDQTFVAAPDYTVLDSFRQLSFPSLVEILMVEQQARRFAWRLGLNEKFRPTCDAESLVGTASQIFHCFEDNFARMVRESFLIFNVPSQCAEEWRHKIDTGLRLEITPGQVMRTI